MAEKKSKAKAKGKTKEKEKKEVTPYAPPRLPMMFDEMDRMFNRFLGKPFGLMRWPKMLWPDEFEAGFPSVDIFEDSKSVTVKAEIPGVKKEDLDVNVTEEAVTISGEKKKEEKTEEKDYYRYERSYGSFRRTLPLPAGVQSAKAKAKFKDGILEIKVPKSPAAIKKERKITIE
jgi:HSP20 family protein